MHGDALLATEVVDVAGRVVTVSWDVVVVVAVTGELQALATAIVGARRAQRGDIIESYAAGRSTEGVRSGCPDRPLGQRS
jgi:hypothetical protein